MRDESNVNRRDEQKMVITKILSYSNNNILNNEPYLSM